jgi:hypothetical protein
MTQDKEFPGERLLGKTGGVVVSLKKNYSQSMDADQKRNAKGCSTIMAFWLGFLFFGVSCEIVKEAGVWKFVVTDNLFFSLGIASWLFALWGVKSWR